MAFLPVAIWTDKTSGFLSPIDT